MNILNLTDSQKIKWIQNLAILGLLVMGVYAPEVWLNTKDFPVIPLFESIPIPESPTDIIICVVFFGLLISQLFLQNKKIGILISVIYLYLCSIDQNRLQPYFYQSILTILFINIFPKQGRERTIIFAVSLLFFATYFWSGVQKINEIFYVQWMGALLKHFSFVPRILLQSFTYAVPFIEALLGIALFIDKTRKIAIFGIISMHSIIVVMLFYLGYGYNVVPWNIQNILSVLILFWTYPTKNAIDVFFKNFNYKKSIVVLFTILLPFSNLFGYWDHLLSFSFFTSKLDYYYIEINDEELKNNLPKNIQKYYRLVDGKTVVYANEWAGDINKVLFYPQKRCILYLENYIQAYAENSNKENLTNLVIYNK
ncbi:MauE/DoxX family redox-associated membrane protein [Flavicella marina]|uniref:MauE/DoxX family redox-associated membrane protein n=1 Tax=Flavicella marina TaxID=1475951 RepID=UPI0012655630|nr:MauE/DoxX family redox-associated membrane protein [Flavicella marina]